MKKTILFIAAFISGMAAFKLIQQSRDPEIIGVYTPYDILWITPEKLTVQTESGFEIKFSSQETLSNWTEYQSANQIMAYDYINNPDIYVDWNYECNDSMKLITWCPDGVYQAGLIVSTDYGIYKIVNP